MHDIPIKKQGLNKPCFEQHGAVKDVSLPGQGTIFMKKKEYIYIPDLKM